MNREALLHDKASVYLIQMIYVEVVAYLRKKLESIEEIEKRIRKMGENIGRTMFIYYRPRKKSPISIMKDFIRVATGLSGVRIKKKFKKQNKKIIVIYKVCPLCNREIETKGLRYCLPTMAIIEEYVNQCIKEGKLKKFNRVEGEVIKSIASGDDRCEYHFYFK
ncbi:MAG: hypothetical protein ACTSRP_21365 [Candidatus Helarchaeota archaeon]